MAMTMTQKILAAHAGLDSVTAGQLIKAKLDMVLAALSAMPIEATPSEPTTLGAEQPI